MFSWGCRGWFLLLVLVTGLSAFVPDAEAGRFRRNRGNGGLVDNQIFNPFFSNPLSGFSSGFLNNGFVNNGFLTGVNSGVFGNNGFFGKNGFFGNNGFNSGLFGNNGLNSGVFGGNGFIGNNQLGNNLFNNVAAIVLRDTSGNLLQVASDGAGNLLDIFGNRLRLRRDRFGNAFDRNGNPIRVAIDNQGVPVLVSVNRNGNLRVLRRNGSAIRPILANANNQLFNNFVGNGFNNNFNFAAAGINPNSFSGNSLPFGLDILTPQQPQATAAQPQQQAAAAQPQAPASTGAPARLRLRGGSAAQTHDLAPGQTVQQLLGSQDLVSLRRREAADGNDETLQAPSRRPAVIDASAL